MQVREVMSSDVKLANPNQSIRDAARLMAQMDCGCLPVGENDRLVGMITDRDIALRAVGKGKSSKTPVREIMSSDVKYCFADQELDEIAKNMADIVGILSLGDVALTDGGGAAGMALCGISEPGGEHSQSTAGANARRSI